MLSRYLHGKDKNRCEGPDSPDLFEEGQQENKAVRESNREGSEVETESQIVRKDLGFNSEQGGVWQ